MKVRTYLCIGCQRTFPLGELLTKQVRWRGAGPMGRVFKSKNIGRYCKGCMTRDEQYRIATRPEILAELKES